MQQAPCLQTLNDQFRIINTVVCVLSCVCLIITLVCYYLIPDLRNSQGKIIVQNILSNILQIIFLIIVYNFSDMLSDSGCKIAGYLGYMFSIAMFLWTAIFSFDLCKTILSERSGFLL